MLSSSHGCTYLWKQPLDQIGFIPVPHTQECDARAETGRLRNRVVPAT